MTPVLRLQTVLTDGVGGVKLSPPVDTIHGDGWSGDTKELYGALPRASERCWHHI